MFDEIMLVISTILIFFTFDMALRSWFDKEDKTFLFRFFDKYPELFFGYRIFSSLSFLYVTILIAINCYKQDNYFGIMNSLIVLTMFEYYHFLLYKKIFK